MMIDKKIEEGRIIYKSGKISIFSFTTTYKDSISFRFLDTFSYWVENSKFVIGAGGNKLYMTYNSMYDAIKMKELLDDVVSEIDTGMQL